MIKETKVIEGYCPLFSGFYNTQFDADFVFGLHLEQESEHFGIEILWDYINFDNKAYMAEIGKLYVREIKDTLVEHGFIKDLTFNKVISPREYNFHSDELDCKFEITKENYENIIKWCKENRKLFNDEIHEKCSNRSGFSSFYSNDGDVWLDMLENDSFKDEEVQIPVILGIILNSGLFEKTDEEIMESWMCNNYLSYFYTYNESTPKEVLEAIEKKSTEV